jgi:(2R)-3-sulfolactate dehydrogenase (NADP+)
MTLVAVAELEATIAAALVRARTSPENAAAVARALTQAEVDGQKGHGLSRVASYAAQSRAGKVDGFAVPVVTRPKPGVLAINVGHGFAYAALDEVVAQLPAMARDNGIAMAGLVRSHHFGVAGRVVERLAEAGLVALVVGNTPQAMASWGGRTPVFGTNPLAFAAPRPGAAPVVVDLALSQVARGKILTAAQKGEPIPAGWALDADGQPTTDAAAALKGTLTPLGGAKGSALAFMVEVLAVALTGANFAFEASSFLDDKGGPPGVGQLVIGIDTGALSGSDVYAGRMAALCGLIESDAGARLPGTRSLALRAKAARDGLEVDDKLYAEARALAGL